MCKYNKESRTDIFCGYYADIEYDKMANGELKHYEDLDHRPKRMISDLLIHSRGVPRNYLAVEMKQNKNYNKRTDDRNRLKGMVSTKPEDSNLRCVYDTLVGAFIIYSSEKVKIEVYENVDGTGEKTEEINMIYVENRGLVLQI